MMLTLTNCNNRRSNTWRKRSSGRRNICRKKLEKFLKEWRWSPKLLMNSKLTMISWWIGIFKTFKNCWKLKQDLKKELKKLLKNLRILNRKFKLIKMFNKKLKVMRILNRKIKLFRIIKNLRTRRTRRKVQVFLQVSSMKRGR